MNQHKDDLIKVSGDILTKEDAEKIVVQASSYNKWNIYEGSDDPLSSENLSERYNVEVSKKDINSFTFSRDTDDRNEICMLQYY